MGVWQECQHEGYLDAVSAMNVSLSGRVAFCRPAVGQGHYASTSEYVRALIRRDQDRQQLRALLLDGVSSDPGPLADADYFAGLRRRLNAAC